MSIFNLSSFDTAENKLLRSDIQERAKDLDVE